jgi:PST family polysaccharide transporter
MRQLRELAKATVFGSAAGVVVGVPLYYFFGNNGIIPTLIATVLSSLCFSTYYVNKINYDKCCISIKDTFVKSSMIIKMGVALMFVSFVGMVNEYIIKIYIASNSDISTVGIYQAGVTIVSGYFSIIVVAMMADYYPRVSAIFDNNDKLITELNKQAKVGLILITPLIVAFMFLMSFFVQFLYSSSFLMATEYMRYAIFGTLIIIVSNPIDVILIAKQNTKVFLLATVFYRLLGLLVSIYSFDLYGLEGLGISMLIMGGVHIVLMQSIMYKLYEIYIDIATLKMFVVSVFFVLVSFFISDISDALARYSLAVIIVFVSICYSIKNFNEVTGFNVYNLVQSKWKKLV